MNDFEMQILKLLSLTDESVWSGVILGAGRRTYGEGWGGRVRQYKNIEERCLYSPSVNMTLGRLLKRGLVEYEELQGLGDFKYGYWQISPEGRELVKQSDIG